MSDAEYRVILTPRQAAFVHFLGRHLRKQEGWWDDEIWRDEVWKVAEMFEAMPGGHPAQFDGDR